jgi:hypothetical protein
MVVALTNAAPTLSAAPPDRLRPQLTGVSFQPRLACQIYTDPSFPSRQITFTLSEPATVTLHKLGLTFGLLPNSYTTGKLRLSAGLHTLDSAYNAFPNDWGGRLTVPVPTAFPFDFETLSTGRMGLDAADGAGNRTSVKWSPYLDIGWGNSSHGEPTNGCT